MSAKLSSQDVLMNQLDGENSNRQFRGLFNKNKAPLSKDVITHDHINGSNTRMAVSKRTYDSVPSVTSSDASPEIPFSSDVNLGQEYSEQSTGDSEGCASNSPAIKTKSFYGASGLTLTDIKEKRKKIMLARIDKASTSSSVVQPKRQKLEKPTLKIVKKNVRKSTKMQMKFSARKKESLHGKEIYVFKDSGGIPSGNCASNTEVSDPMFEGVTAPASNDVIKKATLNAIMSPESDMFISSSESQNNALQSDIKQLVAAICMKYDTGDNHSKTDSVKNELFHGSEKPTENGCSIFCQSPCFSHLGDNPSPNHVNSTDCSALNSAPSNNGNEDAIKAMLSEKKVNVDNVEESGSDSENDLDSSLCSYIDAATDVGSICKDKKNNSNLLSPYKKQIILHSTQTSTDSSMEDDLRAMDSDFQSSLESVASKEDGPATSQEDNNGMNFKNDRAASIRRDISKYNGASCSISETIHQSSSEKIDQRTDKCSQFSSNETGLFRYFQPKSKTTDSSTNSSVKEKRSTKSVLVNTSPSCQKKQNQKFLYQSPSLPFDMTIEEFANSDRYNVYHASYFLIT